MKQSSSKTIVPKPGSYERYTLEQYLSYIGSALHQPIGELHQQNLSEEVKAYLKLNSSKQLHYLETSILIGEGPRFLMKESFTIADAYLYLILSWCPAVGLDLNDFPKIQAYQQHIDSMPAVKSAKERLVTNPSTTFPTTWEQGEMVVAETNCSWCAQFSTRSA